MQVAQLALLGLARLAVTTEFSTGTITPSLQAVPRRARFVAAKVVVVGVVATVAGAVVVLVGGLTAWLGAGIHDHRGLGWILSGGGPAIDAAGLGRAVTLGGLYVLLVSVLTIGLAVLLRSAVATLVTVLALLLVLPGILWESSIQ